MVMYRHIIHGEAIWGGMLQERTLETGKRKEVEEEGG
jgi:hypothetical protein